MEPPPSYDQHGFDDNPPPYDGASVTPSKQAPPEKQPPPSTLILNGCEISSEETPDRILYKATDPPGEAPAKVFQYGIQKRDVGRVYDFRADLVGLNVEILGYGASQRASPAFRMALGADVFNYQISAVGRQQASPLAVTTRDGSIVWTNAAGNLLAVETKAGSGEDGGAAAALPRLDVQAALAAHDLDLLVTCWCARIWNEKKLGDKGMAVRGASGGKGKLLDSSQEVWGKLNIEKAAQAPTIALMKKNREAAQNSTLDKWVFGSWSCDGKGGGSSGGWVDGSGGGGGAS